MPSKQGRKYSLALSIPQPDPHLTSLSLTPSTLAWCPQSSLRIKMTHCDAGEKCPGLLESGWCSREAGRGREARSPATPYTCLPSCESARQGKVK